MSSFRSSSQICSNVRKSHVSQLIRGLHVTIKKSSWSITRIFRGPVTDSLNPSCRTTTRWLGVDWDVEPPPPLPPLENCRKRMAEIKAKEGVIPGTGYLKDAITTEPLVFRRIEGPALQPPSPRSPTAVRCGRLSSCPESWSPNLYKKCIESSIDETLASKFTVPYEEFGYYDKQNRNKEILPGRTGSKYCPIIPLEPICTKNKKKLY